MFEHVPVMMTEVLERLAPAPGKRFLDGTVGGAGHASALLEAGGDVVGLDIDPWAVEAASKRLESFGTRAVVYEASYTEAPERFEGPWDGILVDFGVSSPQLDAAERGFSFRSDGPLDMRMSQQGETAAELIHRLDETSLANLIFGLADERFSRRIARVLKERHPTTTQEAVECVQRAVPRRFWPRDVNVATRTFQALRIAVNGELDNVQHAVTHLPKLLKPNGVLVCLSFQSAEDRIVKHGFASLAAGDEAQFELVDRKPQVPSDEEVERNPRSRSTKLRALRRL